MKKHLFLLGSFMTTSLVTANTLLVISCKKKASKVIKSEGKDNEKSTATIANEKAIKLKAEITNVIDEIITDPNNEDWLIDLKHGVSTDYQEIINNLNNAVDSLNKAEEKKVQILLTKVESLKQEFKDKVSAKFASLKDIIISKIKNLEDQTDLSKFEFNFVSDSIAPMLNNLKGIEFLKAYNKLKEHAKTINALSNPIVKQAGYAATNITELELFKVSIDLNYNFKISGIPFEGEYKNLELFMVGNSMDYDKIRRYTYETINNILTKDEKVKNINIYSSNVHEFEKYGHIGKQMDWDFSTTPVKNEIEAIQTEQLKVVSNNDLFEGKLEIKPNSVDFDIDSSNYMKFDNHDMDLKRLGEDNILISKEENNTKINTKEQAIAKVKEQFEFDADQSSVANDWNGGKINRKFNEQAKLVSEKDSSIINLSDYYGLKNNARTGSKLLIGFGTSNLRTLHYAGMALPTITINTNLTTPFDSGIDKLYANFKEFVGTIVQVLHDNTIRLGKYDKDNYFFDWQFPYEGEWDAIKAEIAKENGDKTVTFDWIMKNALLNKRILEDKSGNYKLPIDEKDIPKEAWSFLNSAIEIKYVPHGEDDYLTVKEEYVYKDAALYVKYGPFIAYIVGKDNTTVWSSTPEWEIVRKKWEQPS